MGLLDIFKKKEQEDVVIEDWLDQKELSFMEGVVNEEVGHSWPGATDKLQSVILGSISPFEGDLAEEMKTMPEDLRAEVVNRVYDLMRNPDFAEIGGIDINYVDILKGGVNWKEMFSEIKSGLGTYNFEHLASGDITSTEAWGKYDPILLYRGQNLIETPTTGTYTNKDALKMMAHYYREYEQMGIEPFRGDLPAMYLGLSDPGEYWNESTELPKDFTKFDSDKPVYDIGNEIGINRRFLEGMYGNEELSKALGLDSMDANYQAIDHPEYGDSYFMKIKTKDTTQVLNALGELKGGKKKAISVGKGIFKDLIVDTSLDLGHFTQSLGYDQETNQYYVSVVDIWDFNKSLGGGNYESWGNISPSIEGLGEGIQMYGRIYIGEEELLNNIIVIEDTATEGNDVAIGRLGQMGKD
tara:strand:- start:1102 stop:2337 length:1236 start_codon:yes stop_codon:yes gene_type:complete